MLLHLFQKTSPPIAEPITRNNNFCLMALVLSAVGKTVATDVEIPGQSTA